VNLVGSGWTGVEAKGGMCATSGDWTGVAAKGGLSATR